jgi:hypothetical protein
MAASTVKGRDSISPGDPQDLTMAQLAALLQAVGIAPLSYRNLMGRNGGMEVWQRGTVPVNVPAASTIYTVDGWVVANGANQGMQVWQVVGLTPASRYAAQFSRNTGVTGVTTSVMEFPLDTDEVVPMRGQYVTLSFWARCNAAWTPAGKTLSYSMWTGTGAPAKRVLGAYTGDVQAFSGSAALTTVAQRFTVTSLVPVDASITCASVMFNWTPVGTAPAGDNFEIDDVQLEIGSVATPFERRPFESELLACQRHYEKSYEYGHPPGTASNVSCTIFINPIAANTGWLTERYKVRKRGIPAITVYSSVSGLPNMVRNSTGTTDVAATGVNHGDTGFMVQFNAATAGHTWLWHWTADASI